LLTVDDEQAFPGCPDQSDGEQSPPKNPSHHAAPDFIWPLSGLPQGLRFLISYDDLAFFFCASVIRLASKPCPLSESVARGTYYFKIKLH
jgi:hypothetical protein